MAARSPSWTTFASRFPAFTALDKGYAQPIPVTADQTQILHEPTAFFDTLCAKIRNARSRVYLATLYVGDQEQALLEVLDRALQDNPQLELCILFDALRGTRQRYVHQSPVNLLVPLLHQYPERVRVSVYHTPDLHGTTKRWYPERYNEAVGLMHIKAYVIDNDVILSGANLSHDYFTNRQDRYIVFNDQPLVAAYYTQLVDTVAKFSYRVALPVNPVHRSAFNLVPCSGFDPVTDPRRFRAMAHQRMQHWIQQWARHVQQNSSAVTLAADTFAIPTVQMAPVGIDQDQTVLLALLRAVDRYAHDHLGTRACFASAYFNFASVFQSAILDNRASFDLLVAAPKANGFYNARGISKYVPTAYSSFEYDFHRMAQKHMDRRTTRLIRIREYCRDGWTFHAKDPAITVIGSSNYGYRSIRRDLEAQMTLFTENTKLQAALGREVQHLNRHTQVVTDQTFGHPLRRVPFWVRAVKPFIRGFF
ncbi:CDP-diacylglycerol--glycerol-3-phosphate 3-phosphatidyltransferase [Dimargaris verticillata]|uniref:CDP-diacylglycerol--glycerol-3-phosphate 3-phosphatidyltransferase n=1 Tax=Dimargaris verticillata TaxID=2761393 RepID=A0A9W8B6F6_9FUNG|nr:CDP-diacylglycerol--glycerol-3-phosphate 3-phosphatidyltransferase [Dimargaris verticillata]